MTIEAKVAFRTRGATAINLAKPNQDRYIRTNLSALSSRLDIAARNTEGMRRGSPDLLSDTGVESEVYSVEPA